MTNLVLNIERREDLKFFEEYALKLGVKFFKLTIEDFNLLTRKKLTEKMGDVNPELDVPEELILETIEEIRAKHYAQKNQSSR